jgi:transcriptional regulator with XRE-family HTH domain
LQLDQERIYMPKQRLQDTRRQSSMATTRKTPSKRRSPPKAANIAERRSVASTASLVDVARQLRSWTDSVLGIAGAAADITMGAAKMLLPKPEQRKALARTGAALRQVRETAGLSLGEVGAAIDLSDPALLELVENGKIVLPFEIILRLASVLGRNDPISFVMRFTRLYNPEIWQTLEQLGIGRLALQAGREREFANLYRANDAARDLSDEDFSAVLGFTRAAFEMAVTFRRKPGGARMHRSKAPNQK